MLEEINRKIKENGFTGSRASDSMIVFSTPSEGQQEPTPLGVSANHCLNRGFDYML